MNECVGEERGDGEQTEAMFPFFISSIPSFLRPFYQWFCGFTLCEQEVFQKLSFCLLQLKEYQIAQVSFSLGFSMHFFEPAASRTISSHLLAKIRMLLLWSWIWKVYPFRGCTFSVLLFSFTQFLYLQFCDASSNYCSSEWSHSSLNSCSNLGLWQWFTQM